MKCLMLSPYSFGCMYYLNCTRNKIPLYVFNTEKDLLQGHGLKGHSRADNQLGNDCVRKLPQEQLLELSSYI